ncbi:NAD(P)/FAD-dependent oxidoreductase [Lactiplantibacillus mudanjiangensis]|uniref:Ferredoxin--NADP reductase n=1 Tax=Lactiplantibacillus mudanjiangensis TaxID=1296538 RepID=A0A660E3G7_9LACO|nr:NAD(P)/FAD-dependent oxidoreductase [Lactiplantibacillus mudanjiangensis]VDG18972.1 ferredoxin--NADP(+) reductase [Lactobacillus sp.] [Lactiplantibacillus mudanjiangensis]VDG25253.1 ferredoxin--NADP(+) reductase [Lactobacillus sp.] [Lactiplantibacillus mudanjiangensis]VDG27493.1 ferredoxin--NADP(+) reductase [Lactobacillus sp.] [Lactiplantibacillus mudanjiangensis]VDG33070.1 ferredoxin--NADP(+) reductase [Lactobacillus sp.] [Lactiplantibacillus mudanjiangensis]
METEYDLTIIGGGPVGMFAAFYAGMRNAKVQLLESLPELGGQVQALYPEKMIHDIAGYPAIKGRELVKQLATQMQTFPIDVHTKSAVTNVTGEMGDFTITTVDGRVSHSKAIIVATGTGAFEPRKLAVPGAEQFEDQQLFYHIPSLADFKDRTVLVAGGGDSAIDMALMLEPVAKQVTIMHRRNQFRAMEHSVDLLKASSVTVKTPFLIKTIERLDNGQLDLMMKEVRGDAEEHVAVDDLVVNYGFIADNKALQAWQVTPSMAHHLITVNSEMNTDVPGIAAIGDAVTFTGKLGLIASGFGEAPNAVNQLMMQLYPERRSPLHSTTLFEKRTHQQA